MIERHSEFHEGDACRVYRAYLRNDQGHFINVTELLCRNDEEAIKEASRLSDEHTVELWERDRKVAVIPAP